VAQGLVRRVGQGVYAVAQAPNTIEFRAAALSLVVSPEAVITDRSAAWLHGIDLLPRSRQSLMPAIQVHLPPGNRSRRPAVTSGERMLAKRDITTVHGLRVTTPLRTACDLGRSLWRYDALAALDQFLRLGVGHEELLEEITRFKGYRGVIQLRYLGPIADPRAESVAESALRLHWYDACLPPPEPQWWVFNDLGVGVYRLDIALPEARYGAEYNGAEFHSSEEDQAADEVRLEWLDTQRSWHIEVFDKSDVYAPDGNAVLRLQQGLVVARRRLALPTAYPTLR
jgi:transcriptional regulator with AbiEi antitoxin domain of type IV toxin-antitoxin system